MIEQNPDSLADKLSRLQEGVDMIMRSHIEMAKSMLEIALRERRQWRRETGLLR